MTVLHILKYRHGQLLRHQRIPGWLLRPLLRLALRLPGKTLRQKHIQLDGLLRAIDQQQPWLHSLTYKEAGQTNYLLLQLDTPER